MDRKDWQTADRPGMSRRTLLGGIATGAIAAALPGRAAADPSAVGPASRRSAEAFQVRLAAARFEQQLPVPPQDGNGDETRLPNRIGCFSKGLPHNHRGEVLAPAYESLLAALRTGDPADFDRIILGGEARLVNPQAGLAFDIQGPDSHALALRPAPRFDSAEQAAEMAEDYWMALARDVPFAHYAGHPLMGRAMSDLSAFPGFRGPREGGTVTPATIFRGATAGDLAGPYVSQFLWRRAPFGAEEIDRRIRTAQPGFDYVTGYSEWLAIQDGRPPALDLLLDAAPRYVRSGRDMAAWVRRDVIFQAYFDAMLVLLDLGLALDRGNPYGASRTQRGFGTFGDPHVASVLCAVATSALKAVWFQKWFVHRRLRPEAFAGCVHNHRRGVAAYPVHAAILASPVLDEIAAATGGCLLPQAYPEGSPVHPSYGAGHAAVAGACVTVLKAFFDESAEVPDPVQATPDGFELRPYQGARLTVGGELNKLASNVALGRNFAGIHWRSDAVGSLELGEAVALRYLAKERFCVHEPFEGFTVTRFDGTTVAV
jgi:membrane-associated phospholipid phosphatase